MIHVINLITVRITIKSGKNERIEGENVKT